MKKHLYNIKVCALRTLPTVNVNEEVVSTINITAEDFPALSIKGEIH